MQLNKLAFTLIELLVVIAVIGILSGLIVVSMSGTTNKATIAKAQIFSSSLRNSIVLNLVSEWKLDENTGTLTVDSWSGANATISGATWKTDSDCVFGSCLSFDGSNDNVNCGYFSNLGISSAITIEAWVKPTTLDQSTNPEIIDKGSSSTDYRMRFQSGGKVYACFYGTTTPTTLSNSLLQAGVFNHVVLSYNGSANLIYINGTLDRNQPNTGTITATTNPLYIASNVSTEFFNGIIDGVRIYNASIPSSQVKQNYFIGLNSLFKNGGINKDEYLSKLNEIAIK